MSIYSTSLENEFYFTQLTLTNILYVNLSIKTTCDAPKPGGPVTTRQPAEYKWRSGYPTPL